MPALGKHTRLFLASFVMLFLELAFIRWLPGQVRILAYYTNFVLMGCFFGIGAGMLAAKSSFDAVRFLAAGPFLLVILALIARPLCVWSMGEDVFVFLQYTEAERSNYWLPTTLVLAIFYTALAAVFFCMGQCVGREFAGDRPLTEYSINLAGSIAGLIAFAATSFFEVPSYLWIAAPALLALLLLPKRGALLAVSACMFLLTAYLVRYADRHTTWSPYHKIEVQWGLDNPGATKFKNPFGDGSDPAALKNAFLVLVNDDSYQVSVDLSDATVARHAWLGRWRAYYDLPYEIKPRPANVLIVGGGTGNDAAAALRGGAKHVDVVEIDPQIVRLGKLHHPERPYDDPRVTLHVDDARHFMRNAEHGKYDLVIFGLIDSHRLFSALSSLRLDSYVFTAESYKEAKRLLSPDGLQVTAFAVGMPWIEANFHETLRAAYGSEVAALHKQESPALSMLFLSGPGLKYIDWGKADATPRAGAEIISDDWPFPYARGKSLSEEYLLSLVLILSISVILLRGRRVLNWGGFDWHFFLLGAGFMLLETRNISAAALLFGSTWLTSVYAILLVLCMALVSNLIVARARFNMARTGYAGLFACLALNYFISVSDVQLSSPAATYTAAGILIGAPFIFTNLIFASSFKRSPRPHASLGANVLGGICGAILEYSSIIFGIRALLLLAAGVYALSALPRGARE